MQASTLYFEMENYIRSLQNDICAGLESLDTVKFKTDQWERPEGGGGITRVIENGSVFEKGGVNISYISGELPGHVAEMLKTQPDEFVVCGLSLVIHPQSPKVPTIHMNVRYFEMKNGTAWFGGGIDLTPYFPAAADFSEFHRSMYNACEAAIPGSYPDFKKQCDDYFYLKHRREMRGIGGIFFDYLKDDPLKNFKLVKSVGDAFLPAYQPIVRRRMNESFSDADKKFQLLRRGRYVEFNLIYDRGTIFGLKTGGRTASILMSLPPEVNFQYNWQPDPDSIHAQMAAYYQPRDWLSKK